MGLRNVLMLIIIVFYLKPFYAIEGGYADKRSYTKGETANFYISTKNSNFEITIDKLTDILIFVQSIPNIKGFEQSSDDSSYYYGFNWLKTYSLKIPDNWTPGAYRISFPTSAGKKAFYIFVKEKVPGSYSDVLLILSDNTWAAYNPVGGKSLYEYNSTNGEKSTKVTFYRPPSAFLGETDFLRYESEFIKWMHNKNQKIEIVSEYDVHSSTSLLKNYKVIFIVGHSEYWSRLERLNIQNFVAAGGKLIILSGNTCFWQVRFEDNGKTLVCYKEALDDPLRTKADSLVTVRWYESPVNYPENPFTGVGFRSGGYVNNNENTLPQAQGYSDYAAYNTYHWIYEGTNIQEGEEFGYDYNIVGGEIDGAKFDWDNGVPVVNGSDFSPLNFKVLGISPAKPVDSEVLNTGTMGMYINKNKGAVFNAATIRWPAGLKDSIVDKITYNVFNKFYSNKLPPEITSWEPSTSEPKEINKQNVFINKREVKFEVNKPINFKITAESHSNLSLKYFWKMNDKVVSTTNSYSFTSNDSSFNTTDVTAYTYNSEDTSRINFKIIGKSQVNPPSVAEGYKLEQNYPNPFNPSTTISFNIIEKSHVTLLIYNLMGEIVAELLNKELDKGSYQVPFNIDNKEFKYASGFYIYTLRAGNFIESKKLMILK